MLTIFLVFAVFVSLPVALIVGILHHLLNVRPNAAAAQRRARRKGKELPAGEWYRLNGYRTIKAHPESVWGKNPKSLFAQGWAFIGVNERNLFVFEDTKSHPYYVYNRSLIDG